MPTIGRFEKSIKQSNGGPAVFKKKPPLIDSDTSFSAGNSPCFAFLKYHLRFSRRMTTENGLIIMADYFWHSVSADYAHGKLGKVGQIEGNSSFFVHI